MSELRPQQPPGKLGVLELGERFEHVAGDRAVFLDISIIAKRAGSTDSKTACLC